MDYSDFQDSLTSNIPPSDYPEALQAMWYDAKRNWKAAHDIAQDMQNSLGSWMHAYLHRKEGDEFNAGYWYGKAGKPFPKMTLEKEHREIVDFILNQ